jgi:hypothetical protein
VLAPDLNNPVELMRGRAENLSGRGASLKKIADAWRPIYQTLNPDQKERLRLLAMNVVRENQRSHAGRRMEMMELEEDEADLKPQHPFENDGPVRPVTPLNCGAFQGRDWSVEISVRGIIDSNLAPSHHCNGSAGA